MNILTKTSITIAILGAAAFAVHTSDSDMVSLPGADHAMQGPSAVASPGVQANTMTVITAEWYAQRAADAAEIAAEDRYETLSYAYADDGQRRNVASNGSTGKANGSLDSETQAATAKMSGPVAKLALAGGPGTSEIIVSYSDRPELFEDGRVEALGGEVLRHYEVLDLLAIRLPNESLIEFAVEDEVERISLDELVLAGSVAARRAANSPKYPSGNAAFAGRGQTVAILDTGVAAHYDLAGPVSQYSFLNGAYPTPTLNGTTVAAGDSEARVDGYGHGTHVAGIIAGNGHGSSGQFRGPAPQTSILSLQVLDADGHGQMSDVMAALDWLLQYGSYFNVTVANLSLGKPITESYATDPLVAAVEAVWDSGIVVVVAAGNFGREGYFSITSPGNSRKVITVGSLTDNGTGDDFSDDYASTYSSRGPTVVDHVVKPDLMAPGNRVVAALSDSSNLAALLPNNVVACSATTTCSDDYIALSGTSMATPVVAAAVALMLEKDPSLTPATVKARLMRSAHKMPESPVVVGAGLLDIDAALNETAVVTGEALSPLMSFDKESGGTLVQDTASLWGDDIWGAGYLWTDGVAANGYLWTDGGVDASGYLWTDGGIWANGYLWTDGGVAAFGYLWTDGVEANGYLWTDGGIDAKGYLWTDGGGFKAMSLYDLDDANPSLNDDDHSSN
jgi:serine protease AprX